MSDESVKNELDKTIDRYEELRLAQLAELRSSIGHRNAAEQMWLEEQTSIRTHRQSVEDDLELRAAQEERRLRILAQCIEIELRTCSALERIAAALEHKR